MIDFDRFWMSVTRFFGRTFKTADAPSVDWSETATMEVIAREMIDLSRLHPKGAEKEQILVRRQGSLVLFTHERTPREERFTKTTLPEPLVEAIALIQRCRPDPVYTYTLILQPAESEGIVELESE